jgi:hypothetical protein
MTTIRMNSAFAVQLLLSHLLGSPDIVAEVIGPNTLSVRILGSYHTEAMQMELALRLQAWQQAQHAAGLDVRAELVDRG